MSTDVVRVSTKVEVEPGVAWEVFTEEIDQWWRHGPRFRLLEDPKSRMCLEPGVGGRLLELRDAPGDESAELGRVTVWQPGERLVLEFRAQSFAPGETTEVEVRFERVPGGTRVSVEHRGWDALAEDHPVRHGLGSEEAFVGMMGLWWADLLLAIRIHLDPHVPTGDGP